MGASGAAADPDLPVATTTVNISIHTAGQTWTTGAYAYDGAGNITAIGTAAAPGTPGYRTYQYDEAARLTKAAIGVGAVATYQYGYDEYGNRRRYAVNQLWVTVAVDASTNRLSDGVYDAAGNQLSRGSTAATYDGFGMMTGYRFDAVNTETFVYNAKDERIGALRGAEWTWSLRDSDDRVIRQYRSSSSDPSASWVWVEDFIYRDGLLLGSQRAGEEGGRRHYHLDHLGSTRLVTGADGSVISEHDFLPFGEERTLIGQQVARGFDRETPHRFTGHERDYDAAAPNAGSSYVDSMHARFYSSTSGRFFSPDPVLGNLRQPQSWNRYVYVTNNPMARIDPSGMSMECISTPGGETCSVTPDFSDDFLAWMEERWDAGAAETENLRYLAAGDLFSAAATVDGLQAFADGVVPFTDPFSANGFYDESDPGLEYSRSIGEITRDVELAIVGAGAASKVGAAASKAVGPLGNWVRVGPSYSRALQQKIAMSIRWGASPAKGGKYVRQIGSPNLRKFNQWLRAQKVPGNSWRVRDGGHFHLFR